MYKFVDYDTRKEYYFNTFEELKKHVENLSLQKGFNLPEEKYIAAPYVDFDDQGYSLSGTCEKSGCRILGTWMKIKCDK